MIHNARTLENKIVILFASIKSHLTPHTLHSKNMSLYYSVMSTGVIEYSTIATDYVTYALVHGCKVHYDAETDEFKVVVFNHIWSRSKTLDEGVVKTLKSVFSSFNVSEDEWIYVDNSAC